jgi:hypothetical protein
MIGAVSALTLSAAAFARRRFGLIVAGAALASIFAGLPISTVEAQSGKVGHGQMGPGQRIPFKAQRQVPQPTPEQKRLQEESLGRTHLPGPPLPEAPASQTLPGAPTASPSEVLPIPSAPAVAPRPQAQPADDGTFTFFLFTAQDPYSGTDTAPVAEPQAAIAADGSTVFYSANWFASFSTDGGASFTFVNPYTQFDPLDGGFCCDQTVIYEPTRDLMIWQLLYLYSPSTGKGSYRTAFANPASVASGGWCVYEWNPGNFGLGSGLWLDYPHVALSSNFVWYSANIFNAGNVWQQTVIWRIPLDPVANCDSLTFDYFLDTQFNFTQVEGATDTMYWASHTSNASMRIYVWGEAGSMPLSTEVTVSAWPNAGRLCPGPDGLNWCARADGRILTGWISNGVIGFMWNASQGSGALGTFPFPYVHVARFDAGLALIDEPIIWNPGGAWIYPAVGVNDRGDIAGTLYFGGGSSFPLMTALILDDFSPAPPPWEVYGVVGSDAGTNGLWGDYYSSRRNGSNGNTWVITGQQLVSGQVEAWYVWMGRARDGSTAMSSVQGTPPTSASSDFLRFWWDDISRQRPPARSP